MWIYLAFLSAILLGLYDICKKYSLKDNAVVPVLFVNTCFCALLAFILPILMPQMPAIALDWKANIHMHGWIFIKSCIVLSSWILGYYALKHLPITIVAPISASRPIFTLWGAFIIFGERLNFYQAAGTLITIISLFCLSLSGKKEGITFSKNRWIFFALLAAILGAVSGLYDKYLMQQYPFTTVLFWYNLYQCILMGVVCFILYRPKQRKLTPFVWKNSILLIAVFLTLADFVYFYALSDADAMISIVSMVRRSSIIVAFIGGIFIFKEKNIRKRLLSLLLLAVAMVLLYLGTSK